ncbi:class I SAM-dependent methyltransferase [Candidatus Pacearchaeota archaeon]|nr:class I SAM-dependent methyltransferase [Candidatus Pacearchaeota archaeon]
MREYLQRNKEAYDVLAQEYADRREDYSVSDRKIVQPFIDYLRGHFDSVRVLELGPGSGLAQLYFYEQRFDSTAIDISPEILRVSRDTAPQTKYLLGDFLEFDFSQLKFEGIFAKAFIHLFPKDDALSVFRKIFDLLVDGGVAFIATTIHDKSEEGYFEKEDYSKKEKRFRRRWNEDELLQELAHIGFKLSKKWYNSEEDKSKNWVNLLVSRPI